MELDTKCMLLQVLETIVEQQHIICELSRNDLMLIESIHGPVSPETLVVAAETVRSTLHSVDALTDKLRQLDAQARSH
jgi:hypothetical protein